MADLVVIVPTRGRPHAARELRQAFADTCTADTFLVFAIDEGETADYEPPYVRTKSRSMVEALNLAADGVLGEVLGLPVAIGFMGDDHRPRTKGWDQAYLDALCELGTGIVYGNDLLQGENLPTQFALTADIVRTLGHMAPPTLTHLYVDNYWRDLGAAANCLRYLPDVVVEHVHPIVGKARWDEHYARVNDSAMYAKDERAYSAYRASHLQADIAKVKALRGAQ